MFGGGLPSLPPADLAVCLPFCPHPPDPPSRREGGDQGYFMQGAPPLASPALSRPRHLQSLLLQCPAGGVSGWSPAALAFSLLFCPIPPTPFPRGEGGDFWFSYARGFAPCIPEVEPARHWLFSAASVLFLPPSPPTPFPAGRGDFCFILPGAGAPGTLLQKPRGTGYTFGTQPLKYYRKHPCQCIFMKVLGGSGDSFKSPPTSPSPKK